jgi:ribokinase
MPTLHIVGNVCIDSTLRVPRFPHPGETLVALSSETGLGGKGANQAIAAARAGAEVVLYAAIGADEAGARVQRALAAEPLTPRLVVGDRATDTSIVLVRPDGENMIVSDTSMALSFEPHRVGELERSLRLGDIVLLQGNLDATATAACIRLARQSSAAVVLNPSPLSADSVFEWPLIELVIANAGEIEALTGEREADAGALVLRSLGAGAVVVSLGALGALLVDGDGIFEIAAPIVEATDTSGAGDVLCGVAVGLIAQGFSRQEAFSRATAAAALSVMRRGAFASCPSREEIKALRAETIRRRSK